ncbi:transmembrane protein 6/97 [Obelidium mucronatum]|nr:transmembrane protein 6/97 [Obelidium mucronatum]
MVEPITSRPGDLAMAAFFAFHIPLTILIDSQFLFPNWAQSTLPEAIRGIATNYLRVTNDYLMIERPLWIQSLLYCELFIQLPIFMYMTYALIVNSKHVRTVGLIYGTSTCTCLVPILFEMILSENGLQSRVQRWMTLGIYMIWFLVPFAVLVAMLFRREGPEQEEGVKRKRKDE